MSSSLTAHLLKRRRVGLKRAILAISAMTLLLVAGCGSEDSEQAAGDTPSKFDGGVLGKPTERPHFTLTGPDGKPFDFFDETKGELTFLFFGYTNCPDVCPVHMAQLSEILARPGMPTAKVVFVTADPTRDTPEALKKFLGNFNPDFIGLTGTDKEIRAAELAAGVPPAQIDTKDGKPDPEGGYTVSHAGQVLAFAPDDLGYTVYPFGTRTAQYAADIPVLSKIKAESGDQAVGQTTTTEPSVQWGGAKLGNLTIADARAVALPKPVKDPRHEGHGGIPGSPGQSTGDAGALYFTVTNSGGADKLTAVTTQSAARVTFRDASTEGAAASAPLTALEVPADGSVPLEPGGVYAKLIDIKPIKAGDMMAVTFTFESGGDLDVLVPVVPVAGASK